MPRPDATQQRPSVEHDAKVPGLQLRHRATRSSWHLWYRLDGREYRPKIGDARIVTRPQARQIALQWLAEIGQGRHPKQATETRTVADLRARYDEQHAPRKKPRSQADDASMWDRHILPALGHRSVEAITTADINDLHHAMRATPYRANRVTALLHKAFNLAVRWGWRPDNPARVERYREHKRRRVPSPDEVRRLYVSTSLSAGVPLDQIGQVVGHASIATTRGYAYLQTDAARLAAEIAGRQFERMKKSPA